MKIPTPRDALDDEKWTGCTMLRVGDKFQRCEECGANCFQKHVTKELRFRCNGCGAVYTGEEKT